MLYGMRGYCPACKCVVEESGCEVRMVGGAQILIRCSSMAGFGWKILCLACVVEGRNRQNDDPERPLIPVPPHAELCGKHPRNVVRSHPAIQTLQMPLPIDPRHVKK